MTYKFDDKSNEKVILMILSITTIGAILSIFIFDGLIIYITAFLVSAFDFYYTRSNIRKNKIRIKELSIIEDTIKLSFFYRRKGTSDLKKADYDTTINERQVIFTIMGEYIILGIANKEDLEEPERWDNLIKDLTTDYNN
ncbi:hypothetical protein [Mucilaginibacter sp.]|uniref:hypothetical protein n=1 Tax=Mucilaginibacter sp. TaxID=1882438 RepID=UPI002623E588|nr:hypothetical protein [Mucilaginibacter sp.]MDB5030438.1 hypothetical protein [Mucilaginibacter sp.]